MPLYQPAIGSAFDDIDGSTRLRYVGELGTDLGRCRQAWAAVVARTWVSTVRRSLLDIQAESERRALTRR